MARDLPPLHALAAFEAAARLRSFAKAAHELSITPSAISHRIRLLEDHYGVRFFLRETRTLALTDEGTIFLESVRDVLATLHAASRRIGSNARKQVTINVAHSFANKWLVEKLDDFHQYQPHVDLEIRALKVTSLSRLLDLRSGEVDIAIRYGRVGDWRGFENIELMPVELFPVASPRYIERLGGLRQPADLVHGVLLHSEREPWRLWFDAVGVAVPSPQQGPSFSDAALLLSAAVGAQGIALARDVLVRRDLAVGRLVRLFDVSVASSSAYYAVYLTRSARPEVDAFVEWLVRECRAECIAGEVIPSVEPKAAGLSRVERATGDR